MKNLPLLALLATTTWAAELGLPPEQAACKPGGFTVLKFSNGVEAKGKADNAFSVLFDSPDYQGNGYDSALRSAMGSWSAVSGSSWRFSFGGYSASAPENGDGVLHVKKGGYSFSSGVLAVTLVSAVSSTGRIVDADIYVNPGVGFSVEGGAFDYESVLLHEMGHALGLDHNDGCTGARTVMQSSIAASTVARSLFEPERDGARYLYTGGGGGGGASTVTVSPTALGFTGTAGGAGPASQTIVVSGTPGTSWTATGAPLTGGNWLGVTPSASVAPGLVTVTATTSGLSAGLYLGKVTVTAGGIAREVSVSLNLNAPVVNTLEVTPGTLSFATVTGGAAPAAQTARLTGTSGLAWTATAAGGGWLRVTPSSGTVPATMTITTVPAGFGPGVYTGKVTVSGGGMTRETAVTLEVAGLPQLVLEPSLLALTSRAGNTAPVCQAVSIRATGSVSLDWTATATATASWLAVLPASGRVPGTLSLCATAGSLAAGTHRAEVTIAGAASNSPQTVAATFTVTATTAVWEGGVVSAAAPAAGQAAAAGQILSVFGTNLAGTTAAATSLPLPVELGSVRVQMGGLAARLLYVSPGQINLVAPSGLAGLAGSVTTLVVYNDRLVTPAVRVPVARQAPGVFTALGTGKGAAAMTHVDGTVVSRAAPLGAGEAVSVYLTGMGPLDPAVGDGEAAPVEPLARATLPVRLLLDGQEAAVLYAGAAPGFAGLQVVVALAPEMLARRFPEVVVEVGGVASNRTSAGGPSLLDVTPASVRGAADVMVVLRGINLAPGSVVVASGERVAAAFTDGPLQTLQVTIPVRLLAGPSVALAVMDPAAAGEAASNAVTLAVER